MILISDERRPHLSCGAKTADPGSFQPPLPFFRITATGLFLLIFWGVFRETFTLARIAIAGVLSAGKPANTELVSLVDRLNGLSVVWMAGMR